MRFSGPTLEKDGLVGRENTFEECDLCKKRVETLLLLLPDPGLIVSKKQPRADAVSLLQLVHNTQFESRAAVSDEAFNRSAGFNVVTGNCHTSCQPNAFGCHFATASNERTFELKAQGSASGANTQWRPNVRRHGVVLSSVSD